MAVDMFLKIDAVAGESEDSKHTGEIDVLAWSWGMSQSGTMHAGGGGGAGKVSVQDISVTKYVDKSTPELMKACCNGQHFEKAVLTVRKAGKTPIESVVITMGSVLITSIATGASGGDDRLTESLTLNFKVVEVDYQPQKADGSADGGKVNMGWDIAKNAEGTVPGKK